MKKITALLGLPDAADEDTVAQAIQSLKDRLEIADEALLDAPGRHDPAEVSRKMSAGLTHDQALAVLDQQVAADEAAKKNAEKGKKAAK